MKLIIISGPSGSGKTRLSKKILKILKHGIILNTDNYYKTGIISNLFSNLVVSYFDRKISFNFKLFKKDLNFILKNGFSSYSYKYNFKKKSIKKLYKKTQNIRYVIIEGIFGREILRSFPDKNCIFIKLNIKKQTCMNRAIKRDFIERGKSKSIAKKDFLKAWELFHNNKNENDSKDKVKKIVLKNEKDIKKLQKKITKIVN